MNEPVDRDELDRRLRQALSAARLPAAPGTLRASLERVPSGAGWSPVPRRWSPGRALPFAVTAVIVIGLVAAGLASRFSSPAASPSPTATAVPTSSAATGSPLPSSPIATVSMVIPWVDAAPPPPESRPTPRPVPPGTRTCRAADLTATAEWQGATGTMAGGIAVTNVSATPCVLDGPPRLVVIKAGTTTMATTYRGSVGRGPAGSVPPGPGLLEPGDRGGWWLFWANWCGKDLVPTTLLVTLPDASGVIVATQDPNSLRLGLGGKPRCDAPESPSSLDVLAFEYLPPEPPLPPLGQNASTSISAPATVTIGQDVVFTVTLTNLGSRPAVFDPCPTYTEDIVVAGLRLKPPADRSYALNCRTIGTALAPGATIVLEMRYPVPATVAPGPAELLWSMDPGGPFDTGAFGRVPIAIVRAPAP
jgi:uncharacterized repeat protein (TIGR01451 family)